MKSSYHRPKPATRPRRRPPTSARSRARLILSLDGDTWFVADDADTERELQALAERLAEVLAAHVGAA